jgi:hypothetical protein
MPDALNKVEFLRDPLWDLRSRKLKYFAGQVLVDLKGPAGLST